MAGSRAAAEAQNEYTEVSASGMESTTWPSKEAHDKDMAQSSRIKADKGSTIDKIRERNKKTKETIDRDS